MFTCVSTFLIKYSINGLCHVHYYCIKLIWLFRVCSYLHFSLMITVNIFSDVPKMGTLPTNILCFTQNIKKNPNVDITCGCVHIRSLSVSTDPSERIKICDCLVMNFHLVVGFVWLICNKQSQICFRFSQNFVLKLIVVTILYIQYYTFSLWCGG